MFRYLLYLNILLNCLSLLPETPVPQNSKSQISQQVCGHLRISNTEDHRSKISSVFLLVGAPNPQSEIQSQGFSEKATDNLENLNPRILGYIHDNIPVKSLFEFPSSPRAPPIKA